MGECVSHRKRKKRKNKNDSTTPTALTPASYRFIVAPMVGGSELAFRLLCRRYGATLAYTPMINAERFAVDAEYRKEQFQTVPADRPLVCHFGGNDPETMLTAARWVEHSCDAIDLNLGCPQRVAAAGHFGSFLLDEVDRPLILNIVRTLAHGLSIPVFVKIRLLSTVPETIRLCEQLADAGALYFIHEHDRSELTSLTGAKLIAIHARYRVSLVRL